MSMADGSKSGIIVHKVLIFCLVCPVDRIDRVRLVVTVLHALLVTVKFLAVEDERNSLRCIDRSLGEFHHLQTLRFSSVGSLFKTVAETMVIMATYITYMLERIVGPCFHCNLRMLDTACDTEFDISLVACNTVHETGILATERAAYGVTDIVAERSHLVKHVCIGFESDLICRISRSRCSPSFAVDHDIRVDGMETLADEVHGLDIMDCHKVETETVDMIFVHPPFERLDHVFAEHLLLGSGLVAAS